MLKEKAQPQAVKAIDWQEYEREKRRLQLLNLSPRDYEAAIRALCDRLNI